MKKILSVILGLALCCMLAALPVCAEETAAPVQAETAEIGDNCTIYHQVTLGGTGKDTGNCEEGMG